MKPSPIIIELVGPAGAGKTTLAKMLVQRQKGMQLVSFPDNIGPKEMFFFAWNTLKLLPIIGSSLLQRPRRTLRRSELVTMLILNGWYGDLEKTATSTSPYIIVDQGPLNLLGHLNRWWSVRTPSRAMTAWYETMCRRWAERLHVVVMLDAANEILIERIRTRKQELSLKDKSSEEISSILDSYRVTYRQVISSMKLAEHMPTILSFNTSLAFVDSQYDEIVSKICEGILV